jgi:SAM-dependent methyltransferase
VTAISIIASEAVKPVPVTIGTGLLGRAAFALRCAFDVQLATICRFLKPRLAQFRGDVLDVGCGAMPFRPLMPDHVRYTGIDVPQAASFGMVRDPQIVDFDGRTIPFDDASFDFLLCTEVLEHAEDPVALVAEMLRVLRPDGMLIATVPFSARVHHSPYDFHRFTRFQLSKMFSGFARADIEARGNDLSVIANKLIVVAMRMMRPSFRWLWRWPLILALAPVATVFLLIAHLSVRFGWGSEDDPLGYAIAAMR